MPPCEEVNSQGRPATRVGFIPAEHLLQQLTDMGFSKDDSIKVCSTYLWFVQCTIGDKLTQDNRFETLY